MRGKQGRGSKGRWLCGLMAAAMLCLGGCGTQKPPVQKHSDHGAFPVVVYNITLQQEPQTLVCLFPEGMAPLEQLGFGDRIVGMGTGCQSGEAVAPAAAGTPDAPDVPAILELQPDLVITNRPMSRNALTSLEDGGSQVLILPEGLSQEELTGIFENLDGSEAQ